MSGRGGQLALRLALLVPRWACEAAYARAILGDPVGVWTSLRIALGGGGRGGEPSAHGRCVHPKFPLQTAEQRQDGGVSCSRISTFRHSVASAVCVML